MPNQRVRARFRLHFYKRTKNSFQTSDSWLATLLRVTDPRSVRELKTHADIYFFP